MPYLAQGIEKHTYSFRAWRWAFFFPGCLQIIWGLMILKFSQVSCPWCHKLYQHSTVATPLCNSPLHHAHPALYSYCNLSLHQWLDCSNCCCMLNTCLDPYTPLWMDKVPIMIGICHDLVYLRLCSQFQNVNFMLLRNSSENTKLAMPTDMLWTVLQRANCMTQHVIPSSFQM